MIPILYSLLILIFSHKVPLLKYDLEKKINIVTNRFFNTRFIDKNLNNSPNLSITGYF